MASTPYSFILGFHGRFNNIVRTPLFNSLDIVVIYLFFLLFGWKFPAPVGKARALVSLLSLVMVEYE